MNFIKELRDGELDLIRTYIGELIDKGTKEGDCWLWMSAINTSGYGYVNLKGIDRNIHTSTHRLMYILEVGDIKPNAIVRHSCQNPSCCNPAHLTIGTKKGLHCINTYLSMEKADAVVELLRKKMTLVEIARELELPFRWVQNLTVGEERYI